MGNFKYRNITSHREHIYTQPQQSFYQAIELEELQSVKKQVTGKNGAELKFVLSFLESKHLIITSGAQSSSCKNFLQLIKYFKIFHHEVLSAMYTFSLQSLFSTSIYRLICWNPTNFYNDYFVFKVF